MNPDDLINLFWQSVPQPLRGTGRFDDWGIVGPALLARSAILLKSIRDLDTSGRELDAAILARSLYEYVATFAWLAAEPDARVPAWLREDHAQRQRGIDFLAQHGRHGDLSNFEGLYAPEDAGAYPHFFNRTREADAFWLPRLEGRAMSREVGNFEAMYGALFRFFSAQVHPTVRALETVVIGTPHAPGEYFLRPHNMQAGEVSRLAAIVFALGLFISGEAFGWPDAARIQALAREAEQGANR